MPAARFTIPGTQLPRPVATDCQVMAMLMLGDGWFRYFSRHDRSRLTMGYWPNQKSRGILQMTGRGGAHEQTGLLPALGQAACPAIRDDSGQTWYDREADLLDQQIAPWRITHTHAHADHQVTSDYLALAQTHGVLVRYHLPSGCRLVLDLHPPPADRQYCIIDPGKDPGTCYGPNGRTEQAFCNIGRPTIHTAGSTVFTGFDQPPDPQHSPCGLLELIAGHLDQAPATHDQPFDQPRQLTIEPDDAGQVLLLFGFADSHAAAEQPIAHARSRPFDEHVQSTEQHWQRYVDAACTAIEQAHHFDLRTLNPTEAALLGHNLIYQQQMRTGAGSFIACPTEQGFSQPRDDGIAGEYAACLGLGAGFLGGVCDGFSRNYITDPHWQAQYWDGWYNNNAPDTDPIHSQTDAVYFAIRMFYLYFRITGDKRYLTRSNLGLMASAVDYLEQRYFDEATGLFRAARVMEAAVVDQHTRCPSGAAMNYVVDLNYATQGFAALIMLAELAKVYGNAELAEGAQQRANVMRPRLMRTFVDSPGNRLRYGLVHGSDGYHTVDAHWTFASPDGRTLESDARFEQSFVMGLSLFDQHMRCFDNAMRDAAMVRFNAERKHRGGFDEILLAATAALRRDKLRMMMQAACRSGMIWAKPDDPDGQFDKCYLAVPYGLPGRVDLAHKPHTIAIMPTLYHLVAYYKSDPPQPILSDA